MFFHCPPNVLTPVSVIRSTTCAAGSCGGMIGIGLAGGAGACATSSLDINTGNAAITAHAIKLPENVTRIVPSLPIARGKDAHSFTRLERLGPLRQATGMRI